MYTLSSILVDLPYLSRGDNDTALTILQFNELLFIGLFQCSVLLTFIVRLYVTFKPSTYRMSNKLIVMFVVIMTLMTLSWFAFCPVFVFTDIANSELSPIAISFFFLYVIGCVLAVHFFVSNLSQLIESRVTTPRLVSGTTMQEIVVDHQQCQ